MIFSHFIRADAVFQTYSCQSRILLQKYFGNSCWEHRRNLFSILERIAPLSVTPRLMPPSRTSNFAQLQAHDPQLLRIGMLAERYFSDDPNTCLLKLRQLAEVLARTTTTPPSMGRRTWRRRRRRRRPRRRWASCGPAPRRGWAGSPSSSPSSSSPPTSPPPSARTTSTRATS